MIRPPVLAFLAALAVPLAAAADLPPAAAPVKAVLPYVDEQTVLVAHVDLHRVDPDRLAALASRFVPDLPGGAAEFRKAAAGVRDSLTAAGAREVFLVLGLADLTDGSPLLVVPLADKAQPDVLARLLRDLVSGGNAPPETFTSHTEGRVLLLGAKAAVERARKVKPQERPELAAAFAAAGDAPARVMLIPPAHLPRVVDELLPELPPEVGGGRTRVLTEGLRWLTAFVRTEPAGLHAVAQSKDAAAARALADFLTRAATALARNPQVREQVPEIEALVRLPKPQVAGDRVTLDLPEKELAQVVPPLVARARANARRAQAMNGMKQVLLAFHNYHDTYTRFPPAVFRDKEGKALLSWRVHVLPYLGEVELYKQFKLDQPWDSEHNKKLIAKMPAVFAGSNARLSAAWRTPFVVPVGKETAFPPDSKGLKISEIADGTSNTIVLLQADDEAAPVWTRPDDLPYDPKEPLKGVAIRPDGTFLVGLGDGSVRAVSKKISKETLHHAITPSGGEVLGPDW